MCNIVVSTHTSRVSTDIVVGTPDIVIGILDIVIGIPGIVAGIRDVCNIVVNTRTSRVSPDIVVGTRRPFSHWSNHGGINSVPLTGGTMYTTDFHSPAGINPRYTTHSLST